MGCCFSCDIDDRCKHPNYSDVYKPYVNTSPSAPPLDVDTCNMCHGVGYVWNGHYNILCFNCNGYKPYSNSLYL